MRRPDFSSILLEVEHSCVEPGRISGREKPPTVCNYNALVSKAIEHLMPSPDAFSIAFLIDLAPYFEQADALWVRGALDLFLLMATSTRCRTVRQFREDFREASRFFRGIAH